MARKDTTTNPSTADRPVPSDAAGESDPGVEPRSTPRWMRTVVAAGAVLLLGAALGMWAHLSGPGLVHPDAASVDVGFCQDMSVHHRQAVLMAGLARERSHDLEIRSLAFDIEHTQLEQIGMMQGWLTLWNAAPLPTGRYMTWTTDSDTMPGMAHSDQEHSGQEHHTGMTGMPGMASPADLNQLRAAEGEEFDVLFLKLMLRHHQGGVPMAAYAAEQAEVTQVRNLASKMLIAQGAESKYLARLITDRGAQPLPSPI